MLHWHKETLNINIIGHFVGTKRPVCLLSWAATSCCESNRLLFVVNVDTVWDDYTLRKHPGDWLGKQIAQIEGRNTFKRQLIKIIFSFKLLLALL